MGALYLDEGELRRIGFSEVNINTFRTLTAFVNLVNRTDELDEDLTTASVLLLATEARVDDLEGRADDIEADIVTINGTLTTLDTRLDAAEAELLLPIDVQDEGIGTAPAKTLNFVGAGVTAATVAGVTTITIP